MTDRGNYEDRHTPDTGGRQCQPSTECTCQPQPLKLAHEPGCPLHSSPATEQDYLEDNIATVAHHLRQDGARLSVGHVKSGKAGLIVEPGEVLREIARRLGVAQPPMPFLCPCCGARGTTDGKASTVPSTTRDTPRAPLNAIQFITLLEILEECAEHVTPELEARIKNVLSYHTDHDTVSSLPPADCGGAK